MSKGAKGLEHGYLPAAPFIRVIDERLAQNDEETEDTITNAIWPGTDARRLRNLRKQEWVSFDVAERILIGLGLANLWLDDPEFRGLYQRVNLRAIDFSQPTCEEAERMRDKRILAAWKKYGSAAKVAQKLGVGLRPVQQVVTAFVQEREDEKDRLILETYDRLGSVPKTALACKAGSARVWRIVNNRHLVKGRAA